MPCKNKVWLHPALVLTMTVLATTVFAGGPIGSTDGVGSEDIAEQFSAPAPLSLEQLGNASGRQGVPIQLQINESQQNAAVSDNLLSGNVVTGNNSISDHAFQHMSGIATVIQNTGNQVVIQDSTMINVLINQ